jgi:hypothetical protein
VQAQSPHGVSQQCGTGKRGDEMPHGFVFFNLA